MVKRVSPRQQRLLRELGGHIRRWRKVNGMTATELAERAFITRETLRHIERGTGTARLGSLMAVLVRLGIAETVIRAANPYESETARIRIDAILGAGGEV